MFDGRHKGENQGRWGWPGRWVDVLVMIKNVRKKIFKVNEYP